MVRLLGFFSSHPRYGLPRVLLWFSIAAIPVLGWCVLIATILVRTTDDRMRFIEDHGRALILYGLIAVGFCVGLGLTIGIAVRAARSKVLVADFGAPSFGILGGIALLLVIGSLPSVIPSVFKLPVPVRAMLAMMGLLPLMLIVCIVSLAPAEDRARGPTSHRFKFWTIVLPAIILALMALWRVWVISDRIAAWPLVEDLLRRFTSAAPSWTGEFAIEGDVDGRHRAWLVTAMAAVVLTPVFAISILVVSWLWDIAASILKRLRKPKRLPADQRVVGRKLLGESETKAIVGNRRLGFSRPVGGDGDGVHGGQTDAAPAPKAAGGDSPPEWIGTLKDIVDPHGECGDWQATRFGPGETSPTFAGPESFSEFFAGIAPSADQVSAFRRVHDRCVQSLGANRDGPGRLQPSSDVLIEGPAGSGRTATAAALIVNSIVMRGHTVLVLVPDRGKVGSTIRRIRRSAEGCGVGWFLNIGDLTREGSEPWTSPGKGTSPEPTKPSSSRSADGLPASMSLDDQRRRNEDNRRLAALERSRVAPDSTPDVLVGTMSEFEQLFFSGSTDYSRLRAVLCRIGLVVVEDLDLLDIRHRIHLPSMLNKVRLVLASEGLQAQTVVVAPQLHDVCRAFVSGRLLAGKERIEPCRLRPFRLPEETQEPWQLTLRPRERGPRQVLALVEQCAKVRAQSGADVWVYAPRMPEEERRELAASIDSAGSGSVKVVADLDELDDSESGNLGAVFHAATDCHGASLAIRSRACQEIVVVTILPAGMPTLEEEPVKSLLVLPHRASKALFASHFRSAARFLRRLRPIHRDFWSGLGLEPAGELRVGQGSDHALPLASIDDDRSVQLDPPDLLVVQAGRRGAWPWATLSMDGAAGSDGSDAAPAPAPVDIDGLLESSRSIEVLPGVYKFSPIDRRCGQDGLTGVSERRHAEWVSDADGHSIALDDLAYRSRFVLERGSSQFIPLAMLENAGQDRGKIDIRGRLWMERVSDAGQASLGVMDVSDLCIPDGFVPQCSLQSAMPQVRLVDMRLDSQRMGRDRDAAYSREKVLDPTLQRQFATFRIAAIADESGGLRGLRPPISIRYEAHTFFVLFGFPQDELEPDRLKPLLCGQWRGRELEPVLGLACAFAFRRLAPGLDRMARFVGFRVPGTGAECRFGLMVVEPATTRRSAQQLVDWVVGDPGLLGEFLSLASRALDDAANLGSGSLLSRGYMAIGARTNTERIELDPHRMTELARFLATMLPQRTQRG